MKTTITMVALVLTGWSYAQKVNLTVNMSGFKNNKGKVQVGLYNSDKSFLETTFKDMVVTIKDKKATVVFEGIEKGEYAVSVFQDENQNGELDTNIFGIPKEDYASSNNAKGMMGPPKYVDAKFTVGADTKIEIKLNE